MYNNLRKLVFENVLHNIAIIRTVFFIVFIISHLGIKAQPCDTLSKHFPGAVILRAEKKKDIPGSIISGCIKLMNKQDMYVAPKLIDNLGNNQRYFGREAQAYWYLKNKDTIFYLNSGKNLRTYRWVFLERIVNGPMELYSFTMKGTTSLIFYTIVEYKYFYL